MDANRFFNYGGDYVRNPNYKKGNGQPKYIISTDATSQNVSSTLLGTADIPTVFNPDKESDRLAQGMLREKLPLRRNDYLNNDFPKILADAQSGLEQARNSLAQTISEGTLGTVKAFADLFDLLTLRELWSDTGYQNPVSSQLEAWQNQIREDVAPIYQDPDVNVLNGGLMNSGFIFGGLPSVISSLTLLIPSKAVSWGLAKSASFVTKKGVRLMRNAEKAHRANQIGETAEAAEAASRVSASAKLNAFVEGNRGQNLKNLADYAVSGITSRLLENYQEARQTYDDAKPIMLQILKGMDSEEKQNAINSLIDRFGEDAADWSSDDSIANLVAQESATETFKDDLWNVFSDIYQMYAIGSVGRVINGPSRAALRRLNRQNINTIGMSDDAVKKMLESITRLQKFGDAASDLAFGAKHTILSELSEAGEEAVNYIAQEEGFNYGKVLLNQEAESSFLSDRLPNYLKAPKLWDSAFWGLAGGVIFNAGAEYGNRFIHAVDKIQKAKQAAKNQVDNPEQPIHIPTFKEAFADTEITLRKANLEQNVKKFNDVKEKIEKINDGKDVFGVSADGTLKTDEEKAIARQRALLEFRDDVLLDAMEAGNYDLAKEYLSSNELKQFFVDNGMMTEEEANMAQRDILRQGDQLKREYDKQLRLIYNTVADWGEQNDADLSTIPSEVFGIIARENIKTELENKHYQNQIDALNKANGVLENDSKDELEKAARENGVDSFKAIIQQIGRAHQLGMIRAEIADIKKKKQHTTAAGQAMIAQYEQTERMLVDEIVKNSTVTSTGLNGEVITNDAASAANLLISAQAVASVELLPFRKGEKHTYQASEGTDKFKKLAEAVNNRDRNLMKELVPSISAILDANPSTETDTDTFLNEVVGLANSKNEIIKNIHDNEGKIKALQNINAQLESNYREIAALELNQLYNKTKINTTKEQIQRRANDIINQLNQGRAAAHESASLLYQQLAKKYGKYAVKVELEANVRYDEHTYLYDNFTEEEKSAYDYMTTLSKFNRAEQDIVLKDIYEALEYNDIYEYSEDKDAVKIINESIKAAKEKSSASQNQNSAAQSSGLNNQSAGTQNAATEQGTGQIKEVVPLEDDEQGEGVGQVVSTTGSAEGGTTEGAAGTSTVSSTGEQEEVSQSSIVAAIDNAISSLEENNPTGIDKAGLRNVVVEQVKPLLNGVEDSTVEDLVDRAFETLEELYEDEGETIESKLAKNIIRLSTIATNSKEDKVIQEANAILDRTFSNLLDHFNRHLSNGTINGKYVIPLEALLRYARHITNSEVEAQEMYNAFTRIIAEHPDKYTTIKGRALNETQLIDSVNASIDTVKENIEKSISGRTLNINGLLDYIDGLKYKDKAKNVEYTKEEKKQLKENVIKAVKSLRPGHKLYVRANYDKAKDKTKNPEGGTFVGGIDFIVVDNDGKETLIAKAPTPMKNDGQTMYMAHLQGWHYEIPLAKEKGKKEYPIQIFFKQLFTSDNKNAKLFRETLVQYETLTSEEAYNGIGDELLDKAYSYLKAFAEDNNTKLKDFEQQSKRDKEGNRERIRHLASLDIYTQDKWNIYVEELNYETTDEDADLWKQNYIESIDQWFNKMVDSNEARHIIERSIENHGTELLDVGVQVESVGKPVLKRTKAEDALPATKAIAEQHKGEIHLAAGDRSNRSQVVVSNGQPLSMGGVDTTGRSVVVINTPDGQRVTINAYPIQANNKLFEDNVKLAAFKEALETRLFELMDEWFLRPNSENLQAFLDMLGHKSAETSKLGGSLFAGFFRSVLPSGNGFSIKYKVNTTTGEIISPTSKEEGEVHFLTFYDTTPLFNSKTGRTSKARAAVQDYVEGKNNPAVVWNINTGDMDAQRQMTIMRDLIKKVLIDSLAVRIDPININADSNSSMDYGSFLGRDADGNLVLKVTGVKKPGAKSKQYAQPNGDIIIPNVGRDGKAGNFSDFIIFNDIVNLTTKPVSGSNFTIFDNSDGDFGIQYTVGENSPVEKVTVEPIVEPLSKIVNDLINNSRPNTNISKAIIKAILSRIGNANPSLYNLTKNSTILNKLLHKNVIFVENFNGATIVYSDNSTDTISDNSTDTISDKVYAAYIPSDATLKIGDKEIKVAKGQIVVGSKFMNLLDGNVTEIDDALHHLLHENVHAFIDDNDKANPELNARYKKDLTELWEEYSRKHPTSSHAMSNPDMDLEEFIIESLTNVDLMRELNETAADVPLNNPKSPKTLLGKLFDKLINWLADVLKGPNGEKFEVNKDNLLAKEYAIFEETIMNTPQELVEKKVRARRATKPHTKVEGPKVVQGELHFAEDEVEEVPVDDGVVGFEVKVRNNHTQIPSTGELVIDNTEDEVPEMPKGIKASTIPMVVPTLRGGLDNVNGDTYFDINEKINNGVLSIKCN